MLGEVIKGRIKETPHMSLRNLERLSGISRSELSNIINGKRGKPKPETLKAIAPHLALPYEYLLHLVGYLSRESWQRMKKGEEFPQEGEIIAKISEPPEVYYTLVRLSPQEQELINQFRSLASEEVKSGLLLYLRLALKAEGK